MSVACSQTLGHTRPASGPRTSENDTVRMPTSFDSVDQRASKNRTSGPASAASAFLLSGCAGVQSALDPQGPHAAAIADIAWVMFAGATVILLLVMVLALLAFRRTPEQRAKTRHNAIILAGGVGLPVVTLSALLVYGVHAMADLRTLPEDVLEIEVVGNRWWWDVHYLGDDGEVITTANEIRVPAGRPVHLSLRSNDVIHSFWVPSLAGKMDLIPGRTNRLVIQADKRGMYRGQCAEFCGAQHARMALHVIAESPADFSRWLDRQRNPGAMPNDDAARRGRAAFAQACAACHTVRGTSIARSPGPDLTHIAGRQFIGAGTLSNTRENLLAFITRTQELKPGSAMPSQAHLDPATQEAIVRYLETLH